MGLDGVEFVMAVEEEFKIAISDAEAEHCVTVGQVVDLVYSRLRQTAEDPCASQHGFYVVRRRLMDALGLKRAQIRPETRLEALIGRKDRRKRWRELVAALAENKSRWPGLVRPKWMRVGLLVIMVAACLGLVVFTWLPFVLSFFAAVAVGLIGVYLTVPFEREFPARFSRVQDLVPFVTTLDAGVWSKEEVFQKVKAITVEQLGVEASKVSLEARFVDDLGLE
jgi:acyl carrier protein